MARPTRATVRSTRPGTVRTAGTARQTRGPAGRRRRPQSGSGGSGWLYGLGGLVLVVLIGLGLRFWTKGQDSTDVKQQMIAIVQELDVSNADRAYLESLVDRYHHDAFDAAYNIGGRRKANTFDVEAYLTELARRMKAAAQSEGHLELASMISVN